MSAASIASPPALSQAGELPAGGAPALPLVIDLDGTLVRCDLLHESMIRLVMRSPETLLAMPGWLLRGKAHFKEQVALRAHPEPETLPYRLALVDWIRQERESGRAVVLCTASDRRLAELVSRTTGLFDEVMASDGRSNLAGERKAGALVERFGAKGFDYAGNAQADVPVWQAARRAIVVGATPAVRRAAAEVAEIEREFAPSPPQARAWLTALRAPQWVKNLLVYLPLFGAHEFTNVPALISVTIAFVAFCLCASAIYLINDLSDLDSDRRHPRKRHRPFAAGTLSIPRGVTVSAALIVTAFSIAALGVNWLFTGWLAVYLGTTVCYSFWLKRKMLVDSLVLAGLYTIRLLAGGAASGTSTGFWLLAFSMFLFLSLALVKRYSELKETLLRGRARTPGRDYMIEDLPLVEMLGIASAFCSVLVLALYINGDTVARLYPHQQAIWMTVPVLLYWISRVWLKAHRGQLEDDPVVFALTDGLSRFTILLFFSALLVATLG